jgi:hypothetical protein
MGASQLYFCKVEIRIKRYRNNATQNNSQENKKIIDPEQ